MIRIALAVVAAVIGGVCAAVLVGNWRWHAEKADAFEQLAVHENARALYREHQLNGLPTPVQRYFRNALTDGHPIVRAAVATQAAEFFINGNWRPLTATQQFRASPPAFVWDARIDMAPLTPAYVRDSYVDGRGSMRARLFGVIKLADAADVPELNLGALQRFLGEAIWLPTALLPSSAVTWTGRDERSALVTLRDRDREVSLVFEFDDTGMVKTISGDRYKDDQGRFALEKWLITCGDTFERDGMAIPLHCEAAWLVDGAPQPYWKGRLTSIAYQYN